MDSEQIGRFRGNIAEFREAEESFFSGGMSAKDYKGISGRFGSYAQKGGERGMIRLRMCGGHLDKDKLGFILDKADQYGVRRIHTTTCETVQLHDLKGDDIAQIMTEALDHGIVTQGGGGDNPRNVSASSLAGVDPDEYFDVYPYAKAAESYLLGIMGSVKLPRKLKVTFSGSPSNETHATFRDLGFVATPEGKFDVWSAGGLGNNPRMGCLVKAGVEPSHVLYCVRAMVDTFVQHGNYENRARARTRYMKDDMGEDAYRQAFLSNLDRLEALGGMDVHPEMPTFPEKDAVAVSGERIFPQKQAGLYYVAYHPVGGDVDPGMLRRISDVIADIDGAELRISPDSTIYIINLDGNEALKVRDATEGGASTLFETSVSCIGGSVCQVGVRDSNGLLKRMISAVKDAGIPDGCLPRFRISGCTSSCGCHQVGAIGLQGATKTVDGENVAAFRMTVNGCGLQGRERFGDDAGAIPEDRIPQMVVEIGKAVQSGGKTFDAWFSGTDGFESIVSKYRI